ncbi:Glucose oxidase protein [Rutstroemia sp. NJR-2017a BBW]|nr:Glucose oxidase protein [Rutstroemia sp. NJR-2017a BBW]
MWSPRCTILSFLATASLVLSETFDFVIIGGGTSGLVVANRLSALNVTVAIIEAGASVRNNSNVTRVDGFTLALNTPIDWQYQSTNQSYAGGQTIGYHAGKALGGTSTLNGMTYTRAPAVQIDSWEKVGNPGWNWQNLFPYYKKSENFTYPTPAQVSAGASFDPNFHGKNGPLNVGYAYDLINGSLQAEVAASWKALGVKHNKDINGGFMNGYTVAQSTLDREQNVREDAARAYYYPVEERRNLKVFLRTNARRIVWVDCDESAEVTARGVEVILENGDLEVIEARREVIVSAGTLRSPTILEHSGVGNKK